MMAWRRKLAIAVPWLNCALVLSAWAVGELGDESYFGAHAPDTFSYLEWSAMALNGPSAFLAGLGARSVSSVVHNRDLAWYLEYGLWAVLAVGQWHGYVRLAGWSRQHRRLRFSLGLVGVMLVLVGLAWFTRTTFASTCTGDFVGYCDPYFWPVRAACLACTGFIIGGIATHTAVAADNPAAGTSV